jgi:acetyl-CoA carboxylase carboxyltransferase component
MNSKPIGADVNFSYPTAEIAVMGADGAVNILYRKATPEERLRLSKITRRNSLIRIALPSRDTSMRLFFLKILATSLFRR